MQIFVVCLPELLDAHLWYPRVGILVKLIRLQQMTFLANATVGSCPPVSIFPMIPTLEMNLMLYNSGLPELRLNGGRESEQGVLSLNSGSDSDACHLSTCTMFFQLSLL